MVCRCQLCGCSEVVECGEKYCTAHVISESYREEGRKLEEIKERD